MSDPRDKLDAVNASAQGELFPELADQEPAAPPRVAGLAPEIWAALLDDEAIRERYWSWVCRRGADDHWYWTGTISDTGHGKLRVGQRHGAIERRVISAHVYGYQLHHGLLRPSPGEDIVVAHDCDEASCQNPACLTAETRAENNRQRSARRWSGPLADVRGAAGRAVAIREAIKEARRTGTSLDVAIAAAAAAGVQAAVALPYGPEEG